MSCEHNWEHIHLVNKIRMDRKFTNGSYVVVCSKCGSIGVQPITGSGLVQNRVALIFETVPND